MADRSGARLCALVFAAALGGMVGCAHPVFVTTSPAATRGFRVAPPTKSYIDAAADVEPAIIQIRSYWRSPTVSIVAWMPDENAYGLRARIRRDGSLVRDHRLYVSTYYLGPGTSNVRARADVVQTVVPAERLLKSTGISRDDYHCFYGKRCSPYETKEMRVPDSMLRTNRDSLAVRLYARAGIETTITIHRDLIDAYLAAVDSVTAELRKK